MATQYPLQNYILKTDLHPQFITNPRVTRTLSCPASATFADLHQALNISFGWANTHPYKFNIPESSDTRGRENIFSPGEPSLIIMDVSSLKNIQNATLDSSKVLLSKVLEDPKILNKAIIYSYGSANYWEHVIFYIGRADPTSQFVCLDGEGHGCAEDVGGYSGWLELLEAYDARNPTRAQKDKMSWFENHASNKDPEGLRREKRWRWNQDKINGFLAELGKSSIGTFGLSNRVPAILVISLDKTSFFDDTYSQILARLRSKADVTEATHVASVMQHLRKPKQEFAAIIVTDAAVMEDEFDTVQEKLVRFARNGGTVVLGFLHSNLGELNDINQAFKTGWSLDWKIGNYASVACVRNAGANSPRIIQALNLPDEYKTKALHLSGTRLEDRIYIPNSGNDYSPAVLAKYGNGQLGWIGELGMVDLLFAMCGI